MASDWTRPRRYLIVYTQRGGSTFLAHCLDSHQDIGCERGEPLNPTHPWWDSMAPLGRGTRARAILDLVLGRPGYHCTVARVNYRHWQLIPTEYASKLDGIIHLHRHNAFRMALSAIINAQKLRVPHTYERLPALSLEIDTEQLLREMNRYIRNVKWMRKELAMLDVPLLLVRYDRLVGGEGAEAEYMDSPETLRITEFLGVSPQVLQCRLKRTNPEPAHKLVTNWEEVEAAIINAGYLSYLKDEAWLKS